VDPLLARRLALPFLAGGYATQQLYEWLSKTRYGGANVGPCDGCLDWLGMLELRVWDPYYSLYLNALGGGPASIARYFSPDEISELDARETAAVVCQSAPFGARLATSKPKSMTYYLESCGRKDIEAVPLYDSHYVPRDGD